MRFDRPQWVTESACVPRQPLDLTGQTYGQLTALRLAPSQSHHTRWVWRCACGNEREFFASNVRQGDVTSCGCVAAKRHAEVAAKLQAQRERGEDIRRHGAIRSQKALERATSWAEKRRIAALKRQHKHTLESWRQMRARCTQQSHGDYPNYGGRGIRVCERWRESFEAFLQDMGPRPDGHTLDRKDNDGDYTPENCQWATYTTQNRNSRHCKLTVDDVRAIRGSTESRAALARHYGVTETAIYLVTTRRSWRDVA